MRKTAFQLFLGVFLLIKTIQAAANGYVLSYISRRDLPEEANGRFRKPYETRNELFMNPRDFVNDMRIKHFGRNNKSNTKCPLASTKFRNSASTLNLVEWASNLYLADIITVVFQDAADEPQSANRLMVFNLTFGLRKNWQLKSKTHDIKNFSMLTMVNHWKYQVYENFLFNETFSSEEPYDEFDRRMILKDPSFHFSDKYINMGPFYFPYQEFPSEMNLDLQSAATCIEFEDIGEQDEFFFTTFDIADAANPDEMLPWDLYAKPLFKPLRASAEVRNEIFTKFCHTCKNPSFRLSHECTDENRKCKVKCEITEPGSGANSIQLRSLDPAVVKRGDHFVEKLLDATWVTHNFGDTLHVNEFGNLTMRINNSSNHKILVYELEYPMIYAEWECTVRSQTSRSSNVTEFIAGNSIEWLWAKGVNYANSREKCGLPFRTNDDKGTGSEIVSRKLDLKPLPGNEQFRNWPWKAEIYLKTAQDRDNSYMLKLSYLLQQANNQMLCNAEMIAPRFAITAWKCFMPLFKIYKKFDITKDIFISIQSKYLSNRFLSDILDHRRLRMAIVLKLDEKYTFDAIYNLWKPVCLPDADSRSLKFKQTECYTVYNLKGHEPKTESVRVNWHYDCAKLAVSQIDDTICREHDPHNIDPQKIVGGGGLVCRAATGRYQILAIVVDFHSNKNGTGLVTRYFDIRPHFKTIADFINQ